MQALISNGNGSVMIADIGDPEPRRDQALVAVEAISVNRGETFQLEAPRRDWRPGKDFAGVVIQAAADGSGPDVGARVVGHGTDSCWAQSVAIGTDRIVELPPEISSEVAAALPLAGLTALRLGRAARLTPGTTVLMTGASGGVGHYFAELVLRADARLTAIVGSPERGRTLRRFGATTLTDIAEAPGGFDVGMDSVGGDSLAHVRRRVEPRGSIIWFGQISRTPAALDFFDWVDGTAGAVITQFHYADSDRPLQRDLATLVEMVAADHLHPVLDRIRPMTDAARAIEDLRHRRILGNLILTWS